MPSSNFTKLIQSFDEDALRRGKQFEKAVKYLLQNDPKHKRKYKHVWLWDEFPERTGPDIGIDLVAKGHDNSLCAIQAKCFDPGRQIPKSEIDSFISAASPRKYAHRMLVATTDGLSVNARKTLRDNHVTLVLKSSLESLESFWPETFLSLGAPRTISKYVPRAHQTQAINDVSSGLQTASRGQLIMACGTGKTLTALWITEHLDSSCTLVLVPSLSLLSQTLSEWSTHANTQWSYLCVCSDETVNKNDDVPISNIDDLPFEVTTKPSDIAKFLKTRGRKIIFSTYQSSAQVARAQKLVGKKFDLTIADEAHRLTGKNDAEFATVLDAKKIPTKKLLFMTATPRTYTPTIKQTASDRGVEISSMDDEKVFGKELHKLSFGQAIEQDLLTDYRVVIVGVTDPQVQELIERRELVSVGGKVETDARTLAAHIGLAKAVKDYDLKKMISFHGKIKTARAFAQDFPKIVEWMPKNHKPSGTFWADTITGAMNSSDRRILLDKLKANIPNQHSLLSNARCLTEGIDVPALDAVAFIDPRSSQVDIIQAVGRAIRKSSNKTLGTIVLPVLIPHDADVKNVLEDTAFKPIWAILNALKSHDGQLANQLDQLRFAIGFLGQDQIRLPTKILLDLPLNIEADASDFSKAITLQIIEKSTPSWQYWYGRLSKYAKETGLANPTQREPGIGTWVNTQRMNMRSGLLSDERKDLLDQLPGWSWNPRNEIWETGIMRTREFLKRNGHLQVTAKYREKDGYKLGQWITLQRSNKRQDYLDESEILELESIPGWIWHGLDDKWLDGLESTKAFFKKFAHYEVPNTGYTYFGKNNLRSWISSQRMHYQSGKLSSERVALLEALPNWIWDPLETSWNESLEELREIALKTGYAVVPDTHTSNSVKDLQRWTSKQRQKYKSGKMDLKRIKKLESLPGWEWKPHDAAFNYGVTQLEKYLEKHLFAELTHAYVSEDGFRLGLWISNLRRKNETRSKALTKSQNAKLREIEPLIFEIKTNSNFIDGCEAFKAFVKREGHSSIPRTHIENGVSLHIWVGNRRQDFKKNRLSKAEVKTLEALPDWSWFKFDAAWDTAFSKLISFMNETGHADVPFAHIQDGFKLGSWVNGQRTRYASKTLQIERVRKLENVKGWTWKSQRSGRSKKA